MAWILDSELYRYIVLPVINDSGYNPVNTAAWALILGLAILGLLRVFPRLGLRIDEQLITCTIPYILAGSSLRVIEDADLLAAPWKYLLITPLIYILVFVVTISVLLLCRWIFREEYYRAYAAFGLLWFMLNLAVLSPLGVQNLWVVGAVFLLGSAWTAGIYLLRTIVPWLGFLDNRYNLMILYAHMLDASSTYIGVDWFGYYEKHVVPTYLIDLFGTAGVMYPLKLVILLPVLSMVDRSLQDRSLKNLIKLALIVLGLAPAVRNTLRLALGI
ncbi:MAG: DUF63 family protein [Methanotrichaceae archaeon]|nr:DUF63 family protein [Methanotrichaceae archaeon]